MRRYKCTDCHKVTESPVIGPHPFVEGETIIGCPDCREVESTLRRVCTFLHCEEIATCGFPTKDGYRHTCGTHYREQTEGQP